MSGSFEYNRKLVDLRNTYVIQYYRKERSRMSYAEYASNVKNGSDDYVRSQLYAFNFGAFDNLKGNQLYFNIMNTICSEMDVRKLW